MPKQAYTYTYTHSHSRAHTHYCGVLPVAVSWGYGSLPELRATGAALIDHPHELLELPLLDRRVRAVGG